MNMKKISIDSHRIATASHTASNAFPTQIISLEQLDKHKSLQSS